MLKEFVEGFVADDRERSIWNFFYFPEQVVWIVASYMLQTRKEMIKFYKAVETYTDIYYTETHVHTHIHLHNYMYRHTRTHKHIYVLMYI